MNYSNKEVIAINDAIMIYEKLVKKNFNKMMKSMENIKIMVDKLETVLKFFIDLNNKEDIVLPKELQNI